MDQLVFGTDGWRDIIGGRFTFANVGRAARAYAHYLLEVGTPSVVVGYDTRFNGRLFAEAVAEVMSACGVRTRLSASYLPTPALSFAVRHFGAGGGVMLTASHNPAPYLGFKLKGPYGGTATSAIYAEVSRRVESEDGFPASAGGSYEEFDVRSDYYQALANLIDLELVRGLQGRFVHDAMGGAAAGWLKGFFVQAGLELELTELRGRPDPMFYGVNPEPIAQNLGPLIGWMAEKEALFAVATDGDGDRLGVVLPGGEFFNSHQIFAVLLDHLYRKGVQGRVVKTFTVSRLVERLAECRGLAVEETPVGFKYIVDAMLEGDVMIGGEESGGIGVAGHLPERDGLANTLLLLEAVAAGGRSVGELYAALEREAGWRHAYDRLDLHLDGNRLKDAVMRSLDNPPQTFDGRRLLSVERLDGVKLNLAGDAWLLFRPSGTEPVLRVYCEAADPASVASILDEAGRYVESFA